MGGNDDYVVRDRAGYTTEKEGKITYLFNDDGMKEATRENGKDKTITVLDNNGWLQTEGTRKKKEQRINGTKSRFYFITLPDEA